MSAITLDGRHPCRAGAGHLHAAVVDDDTITRQLAARTLALAGVETTAFASADAAWESLRQADTPVDVVVTDVEMPGALNGLRLAALVEHAGRGTRVVVMSSSGELLAAARAMGGVAGVLQKPFLPCRLVELVLA